MTPQAADVDRRVARCVGPKESGDLCLIARRKLCERARELSGAVVVLSSRPDPTFPKSCADQRYRFPWRLSAGRATEAWIGNDALEFALGSRDAAADVFYAPPVELIADLCRLAKSRPGFALSRKLEDALHRPISDSKRVGRLR